jgi:pilus assembly protein Flp/PilA
LEWVSFITKSKWEIPMNRILFSLYMKFNDLRTTEDGQDLVEYALVVAVIAFGAVTAMKALSTEIKTAFNAISSDLGTSL